MIQLQDKPKMRRVSLLCLTLGLAASMTIPLRADVVEFAVDPTQSSLTLTSTVFFAGVPLDVSLQGPGSDVADYSGALIVDLTPTTVQLLAGSLLIAGNSGDWLPGTDYSNYPADLEDPGGYVSTYAPANYGLITDLTPLGQVIGVQGLSPSATRDLQIGLLDDLPKPLDTVFFDEGGTSVDFTSGTLYYSSGGWPPITDLAATVSPGATLSLSEPACVTYQGPTQTLVLPFSSLTTFFVNFLVIQFQLEGTIVATRDATGEIVLGDFDGDDDVDAADWSYFSSCMFGPDVGPPSCECRITDLDADQDVDLVDFALLQKNYGGS